MSDFQECGKIIKECVNNYPGYIANSLLAYLNRIATHSPEHACKAARLMGSKEAIAAICWKYNPLEFSMLSQRLVRIAIYQPESFYNVLKLLDKNPDGMSNNLLDLTALEPGQFSKVLEITGKIKGNRAVDFLTPVKTFSTFQGKKFDEILELLEKYPYEYIPRMAECIVTVSFRETERLFSKTLKALSSEKAIETTRKYSKELAADIADHLSYIAGRSPELFNDYCDFLNSSSDVNTRNLERIISDFSMQFKEPNLDIKKEHLQNLAKEEGSLLKKIEAIEVYNSLKNAKLRISPPTLKPEWIEEVKGKVKKAIKNIYGTDIRYDPEYISLLAIPSNELDNSSKKEIKSVLKSVSKKNFNTGKTYSQLIVNELKKGESPSRKAKALIYGLLSQPFRKDKEGKMHTRLGPLKLALKYFKKKNLRKARDCIRNFGPGKAYHLLKDSLNQLEQGHDAAEKSMLLIKKEIIEKSDKKMEELSDMVSQVNGLRMADEKLNYIIFKMQEADVTDLFDNRTTHCCAFFPNGANSSASVGYLKDPNIGLLHAKAAVEKDGKIEEVETSGVAILVNAKDRSGKKVLLVDSVESGDTVSRIKKYDKFNQHYLNAIVEVAKESGAQKIFFNADVANSGPTRFNTFLKTKGLKKCNLWLRKKGNVKEEFYLETFGGWGKPGKFWRSYVEGYVLETS